MAIPEERLQAARAMLESAARPLFFHDDDPDGMCSFVLAYRIVGEGYCVPVKNSPVVTEEYLRKISEYAPDLIVILDKPRVAEEFLQATTTPILWVDHHEPQDTLVGRYPTVTYLNPRTEDDEDNRPTSYWLSRIASTHSWIAAVGCVGDWYLPEFIEEVGRSYPALLPDHWERVEDLYLSSGIGTLIRVLQFNLKGKISEVRKSVMTLARIDDPAEILEQASSRGRYLWRRYQKHAGGYNAMLQQAKECAESATGPLLEFIYENDEQSYTAELSNELLIRYPERVTLVGRKHKGAYKCSLRSVDIDIPKRLQSALEGLDGHGGGHTHACGCVVNEKDWETFLERLKRLFN